MKEILKNVYHWTTFHEGIQDTVHSYYVINKNIAFLIDPRLPEQGLDWFKKHTAPSHIYLTNRLHYRHSDKFMKEFGCTIWCHQSGLNHFTKIQNVQGFDDKQQLPGGVIAYNIDVLCPEETILYFSLEGGVLAIADALICERGKVNFVADELLGENSEEIKQGLIKQFRKILRCKFKHLLFAHGRPIINDAKEVLREFIDAH